MLVLSRKHNEVILIGDKIEVRVVDIRGDKVRLGISAPSGIVIDRLEVRKKKIEAMKTNGNTNACN